jgi:hypothetical protein
MKKILVCLLALSVFYACTKDCEECNKQCDNKQDSTCTCKDSTKPDTSCKVDLTKGLLAYYPFNGNFNDESGNGNNATAMNGAFLTTDYMGRKNSCVGLDGYNDYLIVPGNSKLNSDSFTISVQVLVNSNYRRHAVVSRVNFANSISTISGLGVALPSDNKWSFAAFPNTEDCSKISSYDPSYSLYDSSSLQTARWYSLICTFANGVQKFYVNGVLVGKATRTFTKAKKCDLADLVIGGWWKNDIVSLDGKIDDVRLYGRLLNDCEINKLSEPFVETSCKTDLSNGLLAYYPFNGNFNDESGNGNNGTAKNGAYLTTDFMGRSNKAAGFDGYDDYIIVPGSSKLNADSVTISFQVMVNTINRRHVTVSKINFQTGASLSYGIHCSQPTDNKWNFGVTPGTDPCSSLYSYDPSGSVYSNQIQASKWYSVIASFAGGVEKLYVDGVLISSKTRTFANAKKCDNGDLMIGGWWSSDIVSIDGKIDEVRLYKRELSDCEIAKLANSWN